MADRQPTLEELQAAFEAADEAGETEDAQFFHDEIVRLQEQGVPAQIPGDPPLPPVPDSPYASELQGYQAPPQEGWRTDTILPLQHEWKADETGTRMVDTGETQWAVPGMVQGAWDAFTLPNRVRRGEVNPNSPEGFDEVMNLATYATGASPAVRGAAKVAAKPVTRPVVEAYKKVFPDAPTGGSGSMAIDSLLAKIDRLHAENPDKAKAQIMREEGNKFFEKYEGGMSADEKARLQGILTRGQGPIRSRVEGLADKNFKWGVEPGQLTSFGLGGGMLAGKQGLDQAINMGQKVIAARIGVGVGLKGASGLAKIARNKMTKKDLRDLRDLISSRPPSKRAFEPVKDPNPPPKVQQVTDTPTAATLPPKPRSVMEEYMATPEPVELPAVATPPLRPTGPLAAPNPSGKIKMEIGAKEPKKTGTDPNFLAAQRAAKQDRLRARVKEQESKKEARIKPKALPKEPSQERIAPRIAESVVNKADAANIQKMKEVLAKKKGKPLELTVGPRKGPKRGRGSY